MELRTVLRLVSDAGGDKISQLYQVKLVFRCELCQFKSFYTSFNEVYLEAMSFNRENMKSIFKVIPFKLVPRLPIWKMRFMDGY